MQPIFKSATGQLKVWEKIQILVGDDTDRGEYEARVEDFVNGGVIISQPQFIQGRTLLREGIAVTVTFNGEDAVYQFQSCIRQDKSKIGRQMILTPPTRVRRVQRRLFCRIETTSAVSYAPLEPLLKWEDWEDRLSWTKSMCVDISGGGLQIRTPEKLDVGTQLLMRLEFFRQHDLPRTIVGVCRRVILKNEKLSAGIEYVLANQLKNSMNSEALKRLPESAKQFDVIVQNRLVSSIFAAQVELRKKGLL